jgi:hypothetical protein
MEQMVLQNQGKVMTQFELDKRKINYKEAVFQKLG